MKKLQIIKKTLKNIRKKSWKKHWKKKSYAISIGRLRVENRLIEYNNIMRLPYNISSIGT